MFSATQQIDTSAFTSLSFPKKQSPKTFTTNKKPSRWSLTVVTTLSDERFTALCHWYAEHLGFDGNLQVKTQLEWVDIKDARDLIMATSKTCATEAMLVTAGRFSSGTIDFCKNKPIKLRTSHDVFDAIVSMSPSEQEQLIKEIFTD